MGSPRVRRLRGSIWARPNMCLKTSATDLLWLKSKPALWVDVSHHLNLWWGRKGLSNDEYFRRYGEGAARQDGRGHDGLQGRAWGDPGRCGSRRRLAAEERARQSGEEGRPDRARGAYW